MLRIEICLSFLVIILAATLPNLASVQFEKCETFVRRFAKHRTLTVATVFGLAIIARISLLPVLPVPDPAVHDEFGYLLIADTFAHGRVANPTHSMWPFFDTFHVNQFPTYVAKFFPAQGAFLALGQVLLGHPFWGVVLSCALMSGAICWMLQAWIPPAWAFLGGLLAIIRFGIFSYWADSYWGGAVTALGGALVLGALPRIKRDYRIRDAVWMGIGILLLLNSRPYESMFLLFIVALALLAWMLRRHSPDFPTLFKRVILPLGLMLSLTIVVMMFYFWRTTGKPLQPPYVVNERTYYISPPFPWLPVKPMPSYSSEVLRNFYVNSQLEEYKLAVEHPVLTQFSRVIVFAFFYIGPALSIPFFVLAVALPFGSRLGDLPREVRFFLIIFAACAAGMSLPVYFSPHYPAQLTCVVLALALISMRYIRGWKPRGRPVGIAVGRCMLAACVALIVFRVEASRLNLPLTPPRFKTWASQGYLLPGRLAIEAQLKAAGGLHLVFARDGTDANNNFDWVYNSADIDSSQIVWARDLGLARNQQLIHYYPSRRVWLVETASPSPQLTPYP